MQLNPHQESHQGYIIGIAGQNNAEMQCFYPAEWIALQISLPVKSGDKIQKGLSFRGNEKLEDLGRMSFMIIDHLPMGCKD